jgi:hypothetical protein
MERPIRYSSLTTEHKEHVEKNTHCWHGAFSASEELQTEGYNVTYTASRYGYNMSSHRFHMAIWQ